MSSSYHFLLRPTTPKPLLRLLFRSELATCWIEGASLFKVESPRLVWCVPFFIWVMLMLGTWICSLPCGSLSNTGLTAFRTSWDWADDSCRAPGRYRDCICLRRIIREAMLLLSWLAAPSLCLLIILDIASVYWLSLVVKLCAWPLPCTLLVLASCLDFVKSLSWALPFTLRTGEDSCRLGPLEST